MGRGAADAGAGDGRRQKATSRRAKVKPSSGVSRGFRPASTGHARRSGQHGRAHRSFISPRSIHDQLLPNFLRVTHDAARDVGRVDGLDLLAGELDLGRVGQLDERVELGRADLGNVSEGSTTCSERRTMGAETVLCWYCHASAICAMLLPRASAIFSIALLIAFKATSCTGSTEVSGVYRATGSVAHLQYR